MDTDQLGGMILEEKYRLDREIGSGAMGAVYLATQLMVDRPVAIKLLHAGLSSHERLKQRFEREAKAIGRLNHPNCITLFDFGYSRQIDAFYTVMEFLEGTPMHERVVEGVSIHDALIIARQIATALDHAHHKGILHRDLKPENIFLSQMTDGSELVKVLDFGIARIFQDSEEEQPGQRLTRAGEVFGTPAYISPEQARGERDLTPASDLYALGVMLFEMVEGRLPFWGDSAIDTIMQHITSPIPPITRIDAPTTLKQLIQSLLSKDPKMRPQSGKQLAEELQQIEHEMIASGRGGGGRAAAYEPAFTGEMARPNFASMGNPREAMGTEVDGLSTQPDGNPQAANFAPATVPLASPFAAQSAPGGFGAQPATTGGFGAQPAQPNGFGAPPSMTGGFGAQPATTGSFGAQPAMTGGFGAQPATTGGFGAQPATTGGFGSQPGSGAMGGPSGFQQAPTSPHARPPQPSAPLAQQKAGQSQNTVLLGAAIAALVVIILGLGGMLYHNRTSRAGAPPTPVPKTTAPTPKITPAPLKPSDTAVAGSTNKATPPKEVAKETPKEEPKAVVKEEPPKEEPPKEVVKDDPPKATSRRTRPKSTTRKAQEKPRSSPESLPTKGLFDP